MPLTSETPCSIFRLILWASLWRGSQTENLSLGFCDWKLTVDWTLRQANFASGLGGGDKSRTSDLNRKNLSV
jgi:hypothetical protein